MLKNISIKNLLKIIIFSVVSFFILFMYTANDINKKLYNTVVHIQDEELNLIKFSQELSDILMKVDELIVYQVSLKASNNSDDFELVEEKFPLILSKLNEFKKFAEAQKDPQLINISKSLNFKYIMFTSKSIELFTYDEINSEFFELLTKVSEASNEMNDDLSKLSIYSAQRLQSSLTSFQDDMSSSKSFVIVMGLTIIIFIFVILNTISFNLVKKLNLFEKGIKEFSNNNLDYRIDDLGKNELSNLSNAFNDMAKSLQETIKEKEENHKMLVQQSRLASMGEMIGNIAHQWRQPLSAISSSTSAVQLNKELGILDEKDIDNNINVIMKNCDYLSKTIDDFRNFFKPIKETEVFDVSTLIEDTYIIVKATIQNNNILVNLDIQVGVKSKGYPNELAQVLINLFNNAKDILLEQDTKLKLIEIKLYEDKNSIKIEVHDNGGGIPKNVISKVFDPYFTTKHKSQGTGIGLYMSREIITNHFSGNIFVENKKFVYEDQEFIGASFIIELPKVNS